jgi:hypothetical protein
MARIRGRRRPTTTTHLKVIVVVTSNNGPRQYVRSSVPHPASPFRPVDTEAVIRRLNLIARAREDGAKARDRAQAADAGQSLPPGKASQRSSRGSSALPSAHRKPADGNKRLTAGSPPGCPDAAAIVAHLALVVIN